MEHQTRSPSFHGSGGTLLGIYFVSMLLTVLTLGIYSFWGRTRVRAYLWSQTEFEGDRFAYHGTGGELLRGWARVIGVFFLLYIVLLLLAMVAGEAGQIIGPLVFWGAILVLIPVAILGSRRYRLSRTSWRGIRFSLRGDTREFVGLYLKGLLLSIITLGLYGLHFQTAVRRFLTSSTWFGTEKFEFDGEASELFPRYLRAILFSVLTLGIYAPWWVAERDRWYWNHTTFNGARLRSTVTGGGLLGLAITNLLLVIFTLGIGSAWALVRMRRYLTECLLVEGTLDLTAITQDARAASASGEGLADALDVGGIDVGL